MKIKLYTYLFLSGVFIFLLSSCSTSAIYEKVYPTLSDKKYDSEFPYNSCSEQLEEISNSVKLITCIAYYESYVFTEEMKLTSADIKKTDLKSMSARIINYDNSSSGTATVIYAEGRNTALLTCAHVVNFPDTVITYFNKDEGVLSPFIQSISIKESQANYIPELPERGDVEIVVMDKKNDIAIVGKKFISIASINSNPDIPVFKYPNGKAAELGWGDFVYVFGFPMNYKMISKALVSSPDHAKGNSFLIDAVFNRGFSGGIVLAIRDGVPNFELVGLVKSVPAENEFVLKPLVKNLDVEMNPWLPYKGDFTVEKRQSIKFGITKIIGIETILEFFKTNRSLIEEKGYYIKKFFE
jgi:hypothetical protein